MSEPLTGEQLRGYREIAETFSKYFGPNTGAIPVLLAEVDRLKAENTAFRVTLEEIVKDSPTSNPQWGDSSFGGNTDESESHGYDIAHAGFAAKAKAALNGERA